ncbi:conserved hypothetical protein [Leptospira interrogans serovar Copenhageni str. Fiocruz L1-130]|uniref:Uncharacterized protein n=6 Tax=Leptospira interrogans TaxID=173 RepID=Q72QV4_LEPIC|nr:conserved hypothetical protein [Leptospira interrogans serovar Copenhageni str. Fiocruz L1-130]
MGRLKRHRKDNVSSIQQMRKLGCSRNSEGIGALCCDRRQHIEFFIRPNFLTPSSHFLEFLNDGKNEKSFESYFFRI